MRKHFLEVFFVAGIDETLENQQAFQGKGKIRKTKKPDGEVVTEGSAERVARDVSEGSAPGVEEDANNFLFRKGFTREWVEDVVKDVVLGVVKGMK